MTEGTYDHQIELDNFILSFVDLQYIFRIVM